MICIYRYARARLGGLDSFIRLLLGVELTQSHVVQLLVEKLMDFSSDFTLSSRCSICSTLRQFDAF